MGPHRTTDLDAALSRLNDPTAHLPQEPNGYLLPGNFPPGWTPPADSGPFLPSDDSDEPWETTL